MAKAQLDLVDLKVIFATCEESIELPIDRPALISRLDEDSSLISVPKYFSEIGTDKIMSSKILNSELFIQGFYHLIHLLPRMCNDLSFKVNITEIKSSSGIVTKVHRFEVIVTHIIDRSDYQEISEAEREIFKSAIPEFLSFFEKFTQCGIFSSPVIQILNEFQRRQFSVFYQAPEIFEICKDTKVDCCAICLNELSIGNKAWQTPCSHLYHSECLSRWLETASSCPICRFGLPAEQIWMFKYVHMYPRNWRLETR